jgi:diguanylate cyclase (GGDEF)-like protein
MMKNSVLIADDSMPLHKLVKVHLDGQGLSLRSAYDGDDAIASAISLAPDLILLDVDMPRMTGFDVCRTLKANPLTAYIPIIFLTGKSALTDTASGLELGAVDYIRKPFKVEDLRARVRSALRTQCKSDATSMVDGLTGLWNRDYFDAQVRSLRSSSHRSKHPVSCIIAEIDQIPDITRAKGDNAAQDAIRAVGRILLGQSRATDTVCRFGGGKFVILTDGMTGDRASVVIERLRRHIDQALGSAGITGALAKCSYSTADTFLNPATLFNRADAALRQSKSLRYGQDSSDHSVDDEMRAAA